MTVKQEQSKFSFEELTTGSLQQKWDLIAAVGLPHRHSKGYHGRMALVWELRTNIDTTVRPYSKTIGSLDGNLVPLHSNSHYSKRSSFPSRVEVPIGLKKA